MKLRRYKDGDGKKLYELFYDVVHIINAKDYSKEQLDAWAPLEFDLKKWNQSFLDHFTVVAVEEEIIVGFGDIDKSGYLDRLYAHKDFQRRGIGSKIVKELEKMADSNIITHASITAKPFFEKMGYKVIKEQQVLRKGVYLTNFIMEKSI